jgi:hypothetical protein
MVTNEAKMTTADNAQTLLLAADCQIRRQTAGSGDPAGANSEVLNVQILLFIS